MATEHISEGVRITSDLVGARDLQQVVLWDLGPKKPAAPQRPKPPSGKEGDPEFDLAVLEFRTEALPAYESALLAYKRDKADYEKFERDWGGPHEVQFWSVDAADALQRDPKRYCISSRTRGYGNLKNHGLPVGAKPGHGHDVQRAREKQAEADLVAAGRRDPVFGEQELRQ